MRAFHAYKPTLTAEEREQVQKINKIFGDHGLQVLIEEQQTCSSNQRYDVFIVFDEKAQTGRREKVLPDPAEIRSRMEKGEKAENIADELGVGRATLFRHLKKTEPPSD
jgi:hypothetical protein